MRQKKYMFAAEKSCSLLTVHCSQDRFKDVQVGSMWFSTLHIISPNSLRETQMSRIASKPCMVVGLLHLVSSYDFREAARGFVVFVDTKVNAWSFLINEPDCLKSSVSLSSSLLVGPVAPPETESRGRFCWPNSQGTMLRVLPPVVRLTSPCGRSCG